MIKKKIWGIFSGIPESWGEFFKEVFIIFVISAFIYALILVSITLMLSMLIFNLMRLV